MDGRLAQVVIPAKVIDEQPNHIIGAMYGMIVMEARKVRSGTGVGIHYVLWNARFPHMPLVSNELPADPREAPKDPRDSIPWLDLNIVIGADAGVFVAKWIEVGTGKTLVTSAFKIEPVEKPPAAANQNGEMEKVNGST